MEAFLTTTSNQSDVILVPSVDSSIWFSFIFFILSVIAGASDTISFLGLNGLFTAHITGNLVILAAHVVAGSQVPISQIIAVPIFFVMLAMTKMIASLLERASVPSLLPLLFIHFGLLACCFIAGMVAIKQIQDSNAISVILTGMLGVSAMAVQNALVQTSVKGAPTTAVMTTNITRFTVDMVEVVLGRHPKNKAAALERALNTWPAIIGFFIGCGLGAASFALIGLFALATPAILALITIIMYLLVKS